MTRSQELYEIASAIIPGGVNSPVRAFESVGGDPLFFQSGQGCHLEDVDGTRYIDYVCSWGAMILGHADPHIIDATQTALLNGSSFGASCEPEVLLAQKICQEMPAIEMIRMVNSGTEATMTALRLARAYTKRDKFIKFEGCYHGHSDALLVKAGSGGLTFGVPSSAGVPADLAQHTLVAPFNDLDAVKAYFNEYGDQIAGIIVEPIAGNMNFVLPQPEFLSGLRALCDSYQSVLIFDEVMTGFRVARGGAYQHFAVTPDLITLSKVIGGGLPMGAFGGRRDIMSLLAPLGPVYQAGTLAGNPIAMTAGLAALTHLCHEASFDYLQARSAQLVQGLKQRADAAGVPLQVAHLGGMCGAIFTEQANIATFDDVATLNAEHFNRFFHGMLARGINLPPSPYEAFFVSMAHTEEAIALTLDAAEQVFQQF